LEGTVGQDRALWALEFGLGVDASGFNIYVAGIPGFGRNTTLADCLQPLSAGRAVRAEMSERLREPERNYRGGRNVKKPATHEEEERERDRREDPGEPPPPPQA
jgi:hypothetical protein